jgi:hypothetical protein
MRVHERNGRNDAPSPRAPPSVHGVPIRIIKCTANIVENDINVCRTYSLKDPGSILKKAGTDKKFGADHSHPKSCAGTPTTVDHGLGPWRPHEFLVEGRH